MITAALGSAMTGTAGVRKISRAQGDKIDLKDIDAKLNATGNQDIDPDRFDEA